MNVPVTPSRASWIAGFLLAGCVCSLNGPASADQHILDDLIVVGSLCVGQDCVNGESFGFDTIRLKENNLRIKFHDTSTAASFPSNDWQITANDSTNGGANKFSIDDIDGGRTPFTIEAGAPSHSLYVEDSGRIGLGTSTPTVDLHVKDGDTPTLRLEQDGSSGFTPQTWDMAGNETNFFIRDVSNGSTLPFRIRPSAPTSSIDVEGTTGDVGFGTASPEAPIHVRRTNATAQIFVEEASATEGGRTLYALENNGPVIFKMTDTSADGDEWRFQSQPTNFRIRNQTDDLNFQFTTAGDLNIPGVFISSGVTLNVPDFVFGDDYRLMPLDELRTFIAKERHLPNIPSKKEIADDGLNLTEMQLKLLEKVEELTLYSLQQEKTIRELQARLDALGGQQEE